MPGVEPRHSPSSHSRTTFPSAKTKFADGANKTNFMLKMLSTSKDVSIGFIGTPFDGLGWGENNYRYLETRGSCGRECLLLASQFDSRTKIIAVGF